MQICFKKFEEFGSSKFPFISLFFGETDLQYYRNEYERLTWIIITESYWHTGKLLSRKKRAGRETDRQTDKVLDFALVNHIKGNILLKRTHVISISFVSLRTQMECY